MYNLYTRKIDKIYKDEIFILRKLFFFFFFHNFIHEEEIADSSYF